MTSLDDIDPGDYIVQVWIWDPKKGKAAETLEALEEAKIIFEKHGFLVFSRFFEWWYYSGTPEVRACPLFSRGFLDGGTSGTSEVRMRYAHIFLDSRCNFQNVVFYQGGIRWHKTEVN